MSHTSSPPLFSSGIVQGKISFLSIIVLLVCFVVAYAPVLKSLVHTWATSDDYSHGFFIIPLCLYIGWQKKDRLARTVSHPSVWGLILVIVTLLTYFLASVAGIRTVAALTIIPLWIGIILYLYGAPVVRVLIFPIFLMIFMIPVPSQIYSSLTIPLQLMVSKFSVILTSSLGIPIYAEGNVLHLPGRILEVVEACSGLRSLLTLFLLSLVFGYFSLRSNLLRGILFISAIPVAILVNIVRVSLIVITFYYFDFDLTSGSVHTWLGLTIFFLAMLIIFGEKCILEIWDHSNATK